MAKERSYWKQRARAVITATIRDAIADGVERAELIRRVDASYPFGMRKYHPYACWRAVRQELVFDRKTMPRGFSGHRTLSEATKMRHAGQPELFDDENERPYEKGCGDR